MKPRKAKALLAGLGVLALLLAVLAFSRIQLDLHPLPQATQLELSEPGLAVPLLRREQVTLPYREALPGPQRLRVVRYQLDLQPHLRPQDLARPPQGDAGLPSAPSRALLVSQARNGLDLYLNGVWIAGLPQSSAAVRHKWYRPLLAPLPRKLLRAQGPNTLTLVFTTWEPHLALAPVYLGDLDEASRAYELFYVVSASLAKASNLFCLLAGLFLLGTWLANRRDGALYGQAGATTLLWAALYTLLQWSTMPVALYPLWHGALYACLGALVAALSLFVLNFSGHPLRGRGRAVLLTFAALGAVAYALGGTTVKPWLDHYWLPLLLLAYLGACARLVQFTWRRRSLAAISLLAQSVLSLLVGLHDVNVQTQALVFPARDDGIGPADLLTEPIYLSHLTLPLLLFVVAQILLAQYEAQVRRIREANRTLNATLHQRERELLVSYNRQRDLEHQEVMQVERDRIYRELHDGIGSKLVTALFGVREGDMSRQQLEQQLVATLADLQEIISVTHAAEQRDIQGLVFDFAFRLDTGLGSAGFEVVYDIQEGQDLVLLGEASRHVLRILEETAANTIKHAQATRLSLRLTLEEPGGAAAPVLLIQLADNGQPGQAARRAGFPASGGSGLAGMQRRATAMGGHYRFERGPQGASTELRLPLWGLPTQTGGSFPPFERRRAQR